MKFSGFTIRGGRIRFVAAALNTAVYWELQQREMVYDEQNIVRTLVAEWKRNGPGASINGYDMD